jgi:hypothetical protein
VLSCLLTGKKEEYGKWREESGERKEERDYSATDISLSTFHFPLSSKKNTHTLSTLFNLHLREPALIEGDADVQAESVLRDEVIR